MALFSILCNKKSLQILALYLLREEANKAVAKVLEWKMLQ